METNPFPFYQVITTLKDVITMIAAGIASAVAIMGLQTWRRQLKGRTEYDLARRLLRDTYKIRDAIAGVRNPFQSAAEIAQALKEAGIDAAVGDEKYAVLSAQAVYQRRWKYVVEGFAELDVDVLEAEALWGAEAARLFPPLRLVGGELMNSISAFLRSLQTPPRGGSTAYLDAIDAVLYEGGKPDENAFSKKLKAAVAEIEEYLRRYLKL